VRRFAMFYLGNDVNASRNNQIGVALADDLDGPWQRLANPIIANPVAATWGVGQASAVSVDHRGRLLLFYTWGVHGTFGHVREVDLTDADRPVVGEPVTLSTAGFVSTEGGGDWLNNFDVVVDESRSRVLLVREQHPNPPSAPRFITGSLEITSIAREELLRGGGTWCPVATIDSALTGFARNHNAGFARTMYGAVPDPSQVRVVFTASKAEPELKGMFAPWTYALHEIAGEVPLNPQR
jgi:hypothetical protein